MSDAAVNIPDLVFVGFNRRAAALHRDSGDIVWQCQFPQGTGFVALMLDGENLMASVQGYTYCLDASTGETKWMNKMTGFGFGVPCLASLRGTSLGASLLGQNGSDDGSTTTTSSGAGY
jgi:outer membrane protein assembly factor BamB